ncbi:MAG: EamA family transporter [Candidatus Omnitrophica bacterium]|jgi:drug/metabolite transporter (DMT)-like permease|nr:EamA family transporter [Candidatus Omnitrophota bacterium]
MSKKKVTLKILALLIASDILETAIHFFFKKSVLAESSFQVTNVSSAALFIKTAFSSPYLWAGLFVVVCVFIVWSTILSKIDLSVAVPIASFSYILVPLVSIIFLHEQISLLRWAGIIFILFGVALVSLSSKERIA